MNEPDSSSEEPRDVGDFFEALCAGQSKEQVVEDMVSKGWPRDEATARVQILEEQVSKFLAAGGEPDAPQTPPPEAPMKSFKLYRGDPLKDAGEIATGILKALLALGLTALVMYSCSSM